jgi:hypothetical protein
VFNSRRGYHGLPCTKAGDAALQAMCVEFDSLAVHQLLSIRFAILSPRDGVASVDREAVADNAPIDAGDMNAR